MWIKFELNFMRLKLMRLKLMNKFDKILTKLHSFLGHNGFYGAANRIYILLVEKRNPRFKKQCDKCHMFLNIIENK